MSPALARVHFASGSVDSNSQNDIIQTNSPTPWSQRQTILNKLLPTLVNYTCSLLNTTQIKSTHLQQRLYQINQDHTHCLDQQIGSLVEAAQITLKPTRELKPDHLGLSQEGSPTERRLMERVLKCQLDPNTDFISVRELSSSECGKVELVKSRLSRDEDRNQRNVFVLKTIYKSAAVRMREHIFPEAELAILQLSRSNSSTRQTHQAFVPHLHASFQSSDALHFLTSYIPGRTLADFLSSPVRSSLELEPVLRQWAAEIVLGLNWLHTTHRWVHRDLKPSNILLRANGHLVLNDFGTAAPLICVEPPVIDQYHLDRHGHQVVYEHSKLRVPKRYARTLVGTCDYIAPEVLHTHLHTVMDIIDRDENQSIVEQEDEPGSYGPEVDWWSLGITLYELFYNRPPFYSPAISTTYEQIVSHKGVHQQQFLQFPNTSGLMAPFNSISTNAKNFIKSLLSDPSCRLGSGPTGSAEIQSHAWFQTLDWSTLLTRPFTLFLSSSLAYLD
ncbi:hypothetical protein CROQUDRAFT_446588 [Cronartium quercuum f. sp. fusiforme G11]|uniref:cAMP-dependent protein kinase n=1 Tax=Cronartium quercuum f. sp. fusiforme G11 TaxID=708437 RepID=A0A9P6N5D9_9BASI|nr:hypothetical protein CROQUDRAFT_446588 [Cronartium quercuum f. sp. fusiforme G11]